MCGELFRVWKVFKIISYSDVSVGCCGYRDVHKMAWCTLHTAHVPGVFCFYFTKKIEYS